MFYPGDREILLKSLEACFTHPLGPGSLPEKPSHTMEGNAFGIVPHAGYVYSGPVAAWVYHHLAGLGKPDTVILIGPNHTGYGAPVSVYPTSKWRTPLGDVEIDEAVADYLVRNGRFFFADTQAHLYEHSLEVQLPFLQYIYGDGFSLVPITCIDQRLETMKEVADVLKNLIDSNPSKRFAVLASSDMNHYDDHQTTLAKDEEALKAILSKDVEGLYRAVRRGITVCGYGAIAVVMMIAQGEPQLLKHATSADAGGGYEKTVGYAGIVWR